MRIATDPPVSEKQRRAMQAAAHGKSSLGISKKVGQEFVGKDATTHGAALLMTTPQNEGLFLHRHDGDPSHGGEWDLPGGMKDGNESPEQTAMREAREETGALPYGERALLAQTTADKGFKFHTFHQPIMRKFTPRISGEHSEYKWAPLSQPPEPLHPGVKEVLSKLPAEQKPEQAMDAVLAFDRATVRTVDQDGRLHVEITNISKANICPYKGSEIPGADELGLEADRVYYLLRDPQELAKAAPTFNNLPLLSEHIPVSAEDPQKDVVVGSTGTDAVFVAPYLRNSLVVWDKEAIDGVESKEQQEISCAYHYVADMTPGVFDGKSYDGVMRNIRGNHVALVAAGRAGPDVVVGDSKFKDTILMTTQAKDAGNEKHDPSNGQFTSGGGGGSGKSDLKGTPASRKFALQGRIENLRATIKKSNQGGGNNKTLDQSRQKLLADLEKEMKAMDSQQLASDRARTRSRSTTLESKFMSKSLSKQAVLAKGALLASLTLAADSMPNLDALLAGVTSKNWKDKKPGIVAKLKSVMAKDADLSDVVQLLDKLDGAAGPDEEMDDMDENIVEDSPVEEVLAMLRGKLSDEEVEAVKQKLMSMAPAAADADMKDDKDKEKDMAKDTPSPFQGKPDDPVPKKAMDTAIKFAVDKAQKEAKLATDAAIKAATKKAEETTVARLRAVAEAEEAVRPYVGKLAVACDSAEDVYKNALEALGVKVEGVHPSAYRHILEAQGRPGPELRIVAQDTAMPDGFEKKYPNARRLS